MTKNPAILAALILLTLSLSKGEAAAQSPNIACDHIPTNPTQGEVTANLATDCLDNSANRWLEIATADADVALTAAQQNENGLLKFTGALTAGRTVTLQANDRRLVVWNATTGGFNLTFTYATGTTLVVRPTVVALIHGDASAPAVIGTDPDIMRYGTAGVTGTEDYFLFWDASAATLKRALGDNLPGGGGGGSGSAAGVPFRGARVQLDADATGLTFPVIVSWDSAAHDTGTIWSAGDPTKLTVETGVTRVRLIASVKLPDSGTTGSLILSIRKNQTGIDESTLAGASSWTVRESATGSTFNSAVVVTDALAVSGGDYFDLKVSRSGLGSPTSIVAGIHTWFALQVIESSESAAFAEPVEFHVAGAVPISTVVLKKVTTTRLWAMADELADSQCHAGTAPSGGTATFDVQRNAVSIGTITFADAAAVATFTTAAAVEEQWATAGDRLDIVSGATLNSIADVACNLFAYRINP